MCVKTLLSTLQSTSVGQDLMHANTITCFNPKKCLFVMQFLVHQNIRYMQVNVGYMWLKYSLSDNDMT
jgi:hypothetical protein